MSLISRRFLLSLALLLSCAAAFGQTFTTLHSFTGADGSFPLGQLIQGQDGALYGTTHDGGAGFGTIFKIAPDGSAFTSYSLPGNLQGPWSGLSQGPDGTLYGTSLFGGISTLAKGAVFKVQPDGSGLTQLYAFTGGADGGWPHSAPVPGGDGYLYGGTQGFGGPAEVGVLYKLATDGSQFSVLHTFNGSDGAGAFGGLLTGTDGFLYGTTYNGGTANFGTVFKISRDGATFQSLYAFSGPDYGHVTALVQGSDGQLYGASVGATDGSTAGTVYTLTPDGTGFTRLAAFGPYNTASLLGIADQFARVSVTLGPDGNLYGASVAGGTNGTLFRMGRDGSGLTTLYTFSPLDSSNLNRDGAYPLATLIASNGCLYGTTPYGGASGHGTIFKLSLPPAYGIQTLYDQTRAVRSGATLPIKLQLLDPNGVNVSAFSLVVHAVSVTQASTNAPGSLEDSGNANPDLDFRYDSSLAGYIFNLSTRGYAMGTYKLNFNAGADPAVHSVQFEVK